MRVKVITICGILVILILTYLFFSIRVYEFKILLLLAIIVYYLINKALKFNDIL